MNEVVEAKFPKIYKPLDNDWRYKAIYGGRGKGASWTVARKLLIRGTEAPLRILCTRELQKSIKQSVHRLLSDQTNRLQLQHFYDIQQQGIFGKNGTEIFFLGVKANPEEIKYLILSVTTVVLPVPAPAMINNGPLPYFIAFN